MDYEPVDMGYFFCIEALRPVNRKDILILDLARPLGDSLREEQKEVALIDVRSVVGYIQKEGYRGVVANFTGDDPTLSVADRYCRSFRENRIAYWLVNCPPRFREQSGRNAKSIDEAVERLLKSMK